FTCDADAGALIDSGGDLDGQRPALQRTALALTFGARVGDGDAMAVTGRAAALDHEEALLRTDLARAAAGVAAVGHGSAAGAVAFTRLARGHRLDVDGRRLAGEALLERELEVVAQVGPASGILPST